jgi:hypothetical protein
MTVYIKDNEIITESGYSKEEIEELHSKGYASVEVPDTDNPSSYKVESFILENGAYKLK